MPLIAPSSPLGGALLTNRKRKARMIKALIQRHKQHEHQFVNDSNESDQPSHSQEPSTALVRQLAISNSGLIKDEFRKMLWPLLALKARRFVAIKPYDVLHGLYDCKSFTELIVWLLLRGKRFITDEHRIREPNRQFTNMSMSDRLSEASDSSQQGDSNCSTPTGSMLSLIPTADSFTLADLQEHEEWRQVEMDVRRTLARFPPNISDKKRCTLQDELTPLIVDIMCHNRHYHYYQGFHDVCLTLLLVLGRKQAAIVASELADCGIFHRFLTEPLEEVAPPMIQLIYVIIRQTDIELERYIRAAELGHMFALSWMLTWFAHSIDNYEHVVRLYDLFLASHHLMPVYFAAALLLYRATEIMEHCDCEMTQIHSLLTRMKPRHFPLEALIADAQDLFMQYPPSALTGELSERYETDVKHERAHRQLVRRRQPGLPALINIVPLMRPNMRRNATSASLWAFTATATVAWYFYSHMAYKWSG